MKYIRNIQILVLACSLGVIAGCSDQPVQFEEGDLPFKDVVQNVGRTTSRVDSSLVFVLKGSAGFSPNVILGEFNQQKSSVLLKFSNLLTGLPVQSARLTLRPTFVYGTSENRFTATVYEITSPWSESEPPDITYDANNPRASFNVGPLLTEPDEVVLPLDLVQFWADASADSLLENDGILITLDNADFAKQYSVDSSIVLSVGYGVDSVVTTLFHRPEIETYILEGDFETDQNYFISDFASHRLIMRFDLSAIPDHAVVNSAQFVMKFDREHSILGAESRYSFAVWRVETDDWEPPSLLVSTVGSGFGVLDVNQDAPELRVSLVDMVQTWVADKNTNKGLQVNSLREYQDLAFFSFYSDPADSLTRPRLEIQYTTFEPF